MYTQNQEAYKRGLVLGLTMAEIVILVLFCLLMAIALIFREQRKEIFNQAEKIKLKKEMIVELKEKVSIESDPRSLRLVAILKEYWEQYKPEEEEARQFFNELVLQVQELKNLRKELESLTERSDKLEKELKVAVERYQKVIETEGEHYWPPIINLSEADGFYFETGSAVLSDSFIQALSISIIPRLINIIEGYNVDVVEIVGHTDEQPISQRQSNLDEALSLVFNHNASITTLIPSDNAGLGLLRAISVARVLLSDERIPAKVKILPLSGAQLIEYGDKLTDWAYSGAVTERRRIEIRVRRST